MPSSYQPLNDPSERQQFNIIDPEIQQLQERDQRIKYRVRKLRIFIRTLGFGCSVVVVSLMIANLVVFYRTEQTVINGVSLWPQTSKLWPTYVTLGVAALSVILATATLLAYFWGTKYANRWNIARTTLTFVSIGFAVVLWGIAAYGLQSTSSWDGVGSRSLWSSTCDATDQQREIFGHVINFQRFCLMQSWGVVCAGIEIGVEVLTVISYIYVVLRIRHKRRMRRVVSNLNAPAYRQEYVGTPPIYVEPPSPLPSPYFDNKHQERQTSQPYED